MGRGRVGNSTAGERRLARDGDPLLFVRAVASDVIRLPIRRCPECGYVGPTRKFAEEDGARYRCPRCGHAVEAPDPRLV
ncbi:hypothetical protein [Halorussus ruber]|uniref:hypothetical protein n=1 Tax=Halorussus ruber TaxID=1126238 RepID=UPI00109235C0|nr:hypothetical protein [Halorussus ruber]